MTSYFEDQFKARGQFRINVPTTTTVTDVLMKLRQLIEPRMKQTRGSHLHRVDGIRLHPTSAHNKLEVYATGWGSDLTTTTIADIYAILNQPGTDKFDLEYDWPVDVPMAMDHYTDDVTQHQTSQRSVDVPETKTKDNVGPPSPSLAGIAPNHLPVLLPASTPLHRVLLQPGPELELAPEPHLESEPASLSHLAVQTHDQHEQHEQEQPQQQQEQEQPQQHLHVTHQHQHQLQHAQHHPHQQKVHSTQLMAHEAPVLANVQDNCIDPTNAYAGWQGQHQPTMHPPASAHSHSPDLDVQGEDSVLTWGELPPTAVRCAFFTMDSAVLGLRPLGCDCGLVPFSTAIYYTRGCHWNPCMLA
jgi:hypothetical protein